MRAERLQNLCGVDNPRARGRLRALRPSTAAAFLHQTAATAVERRGGFQPMRPTNRDSLFYCHCRRRRAPCCDCRFIRRAAATPPPPTTVATNVRRQRRRASDDGERRPPSAFENARVFERVAARVATAAALWIVCRLPSRFFVKSRRRRRRRRRHHRSWQTRRQASESVEAAARRLPIF